MDNRETPNEQQAGYTGAEDKPASAQPSPAQPAKLSTTEKVGNGFRAVGLVAVGGFWTIAPIAFAVSTQNWWGLLLVLYGLYVLSGLATGKSRFLIY